MKGFAADEAIRKIERIMPNLGSRVIDAFAQLNDNHDSHIVTLTSIETLEPA